VTFNQVRRQVVSAASFHPDAYEDVRDDPAATVYAVGVVVIATLFAAIGGFLWVRFAAAPPPIFETDTSRFLLRSVVLGSVFQVGLWAAWVGMTWFFLRQIYLLPDVPLAPLVRTMGFAFAPMGLQLLLAFPVLEFPIGIIAIAGTLGCTVLAVRAASGATPGQSLIATMAGFLVFALALGILGNSDSDLAPGIFALDPNAISVGLRLK
jgi:hypothetical protein